ncbi:MAG TPA: sensor domain-containing diguanylate cyclase [Actinomycetota bacterium]|nr:sensor domain-containing diguanylate cyclase [Actinomycetota bacterium]
MSRAKSELTQSSEMVSLTERLGYMLVLRLGIILVITVSSVVIESVAAADAMEILWINAAYLGLSLCIEAMRRLWRGRGLLIIGSMLLIDGVYLAWVMYATGGVNSPLKFLLYVHLIAVSILASYRTGLKIALWHSLLLFVVFYAQLAGLLKPLIPIAESMKEARAEFHRMSAIDIIAFWAIAMGTAAFSYVNERELRRRKIDLESLEEMSRDLKDVLDPTMIADLLLEKIASAFNFRRGVVIQKRDGDLFMMASRGGQMGPGSSPVVDSVVQRAWEEHASVRVKHLSPKEDPWLSNLLPDARSVLVVPLAAEGKPIGAVALEHPKRLGGYIEGRVLAMIEQFSAHASLALRNTWLLEEVRKLADTDPLTGIANRRVFERTLERELARSDRHGEPVSLVMVDIDHFKALNDEHGHRVGDQVLKQVARALQDTCRSFDTAARYGGEEFAIVLPNCVSSDAVEIAERLRVFITRLDVVVPITVSVGVASYPMNSSDAEGLVKAADAALYEAKRGGRNVVRVAPRGVRHSAPLAPPPPSEPSPAPLSSDAALSEGWLAPPA